MKVSFEERYQALNKGQQQAVDTIEGPVMVIAGPGSGKTELLSLRVGNILKIGNAKASNILCLTFTETAARNMRERLETLIGPDAYRVAIYTFHSFCTDIIGRYPEYFFNHVSFKPASDLTQSEILQAIFERLPHKHPLGSFHPERGYAYLKEAQVRIKDIKKGGLTPNRFKELLDENAKSYTKLHDILGKLLPERVGKDSAIAFEQMAEAFVKEGGSIGSVYASSIKRALEEVEVSEKNTPLSAWKSAYTAKDDDGKRVLKDYISLPKLYALVEIYEKYQKALYDGGYFDYEDMILEVVEALAKHTSLRTELEEMYQYIMVDEFQDTNNAQLSLVKAISSNAVHEGRANVCVVGDDDQAIYKFQGAEISNIHSFRELYKDVEVIVLTENYRSTQAVLDFARKVVIQGVNRLEGKYKEIKKELIAKNSSLPSGEIKTLSFTSQEEEYAYVGEQIKNLLKEGVEAKEIAVIGREHKQLTTLLPYLDKNSTPYTYTRKENVFDERHVEELIILCRFLATVGDSVFSREDLLPQILAFPFWGLDRISVWRIAEHAKKNNLSWLASMEASEDAKIQSLAHFLIELGVLSQTTPLEIILDTLIGSKDMPTTPEGEHDDFITSTPMLLSKPFTSPYKSYYFGENALKQAPSSYIHFLSSLRVFMRALREWKQGEILKASDVGNFVDMHIAYKIPLINETPFAHNEQSVQLLTSHGAKGLEFAYVFIISVNDSIWAGGRKGSKLSFPANLPLASAGDTEDDFIRLFYVALTRARHTLYITHHDSLFRFLAHEGGQGGATSEEGTNLEEVLTHGLSVYHAPPFASDEKALLKKVVEGYMLSPTHLNNFLDVTQGGPIKFLEQNILRFPQAKTVSSVYGSAIHKTLEEAHVFARANKQIPTLEMLKKSFRRELAYGRLLSFEEEKYAARGEKVLDAYYTLKKESFDGKAIVECNFAKQGVMVDGAHITGKIDMITLLPDNGFVVTDLKTGKGFNSFDEPKQSIYDEIKLHHYRYQLMMYKILVENSRDYSSYEVKEGVLEFVEEEVDGSIQNIKLTFDTNETKEEIERCKKLMSVMYKKIMSLDFPETDKYPKTLEGIMQFEDDLISGVL